MALIKLNVGGTWKNVWGYYSSTSYKKEKLNVGGTWKIPSMIKLNVSSTWKTIST